MGAILAMLACSVGQAALGAIEGRLCYPGESIPAFDLYAVRVDEPAQSPLVVVTKPGQATYRIESVPAGTYHVFVYADDPSFNNIGAAYTRFVVCGSNQSCEDHSLIDVKVGSGETVRSVNPCDFYAPQFLPPRPSPKS
jgi:hypothetical protein